ncbi:MAG: SDR family oxidoreductase [Balneolaceae bacterium]
MKRVLIIGANGKVGRILADKLSSSRMSPTAAIRKESQKKYFEQQNIDTRIADLEESVESLADAMTGIDAVVFSAGSGGSTGLDKTFSIDLDGAVKSMEAAKKARVSRYVMVSAIHAGDRNAFQQSPIKSYYIAKYYADRLLMSMKLDYTILRPGRLLDKPGSGRITITNPAESRGVPREDVAELARLALIHDNTIGKAIKFNQGETPIEEIVKSL